MIDSSLIQQVLHSTLSDTTRLFSLTGDAPINDLLIEAWHGRDAVNEPFRYVLTCLSTRADIDPSDLLARRAQLWTATADGRRTSRSGLVFQASDPEFDGALARYRLVVQPWLARLRYCRRPRAFENKTTLQIIESVFADHPGLADWKLAPEVDAFLDDAPVRRYTYQYRDTDYAFLTRLLSEEGLNFRFEEDETAPHGHTLVIFAASADAPEDPSSANDLAGRGIRHHRGHSQEENDAIQVWGQQLHLLPAVSTTLAWHDEHKHAVTARVTAHAPVGGPHAPQLETYAVASAGSFEHAAHAQRAATLAREALEARSETWPARSTVRSLRAATTFHLTRSSLDELSALLGRWEGAQGMAQGMAQRQGRPAPDAEAERQFFVTEVTHIGINNLPKALAQAVTLGLDPAQRWGDLDAARGPIAARLPPEVLKQAETTGYGNAFSAIRASVPWRPERIPKPRAPGLLNAVVAGPRGETTPHGADAIHTDAQGRIRIRFLEQEGTASPWVRVAQRYAGPQMGTQFIPRIGQEVAVQFIDGDLDRPIVIGGLYNGRGEGGVPRTPGGDPRSVDPKAQEVFKRATDHRPSGQGNLAGAHSPAWHGASPEAAGHRNAAALSGIKSQEFGAEGANAGSNQLVFDDTDQQLRVQMKSTQHATELNLGHLIHQADNYRGSFRGKGWELCTDAHGAVRTCRAILISTFGTHPHEPAQDNAPGIALARQAAAQAKALSQAARTHQTVAFATDVGSVTANASVLSPSHGPLTALLRVLQGMVHATRLDAALDDAVRTNTSTSADRIPAPTEPVVTVVGKAGIGLVAGQDQHWAAGDTLSVQAGQDLNLGVGEQLRVHTGQAIGVLGGAVKAGSGAAGTGLSLIAGAGPIDVQAQADTLQIAAKDDVKLVSVNASITLASPKTIEFKTAGGACITLASGQLTVSCPGKITVHAATKSFVGAESVSQAMNSWPKTSFDDVFVVRDEDTHEPIRNTWVEVTRADGAKLKLRTDGDGRLPMQRSEFIENMRIRVLGK